MDDDLDLDLDLDHDHDISHLGDGEIGALLIDLMIRDAEKRRDEAIADIARFRLSKVKW